MNSMDLQGKAVITGRDLEAAVNAGAGEIVLSSDAVVTSTAKDIVVGHGITVKRTAVVIMRPVLATPAGPKAYFGSIESLFNSSEAMAIKKEMVQTGRKLWQRDFVDGNGGNISYRISDQYVLCTPTLVSKNDLTVEDICMVRLEDGKQVAGHNKSTSEIILHLEIMKAQPKAKACVHAHPPHATAYAITGVTPPNCIIPEAEIFVGMVAFSPYGTPGTKSVADQVVPLAKDHNTILMGNHGLVCWADSVTHAEWCVEVVETYCRTLMLAAQLGQPITRISDNETTALLETKRKLGIVDPRFTGKECALCDVPIENCGITVCPKECQAGAKGCCKVHGTSACPGNCGKSKAAGPAAPETEALINQITDQVMAALKLKG